METVLEGNGMEEVKSRVNAIEETKSPNRRLTNIRSPLYPEDNHNNRRQTDA